MNINNKNNENNEHTTFGNIDMKKLEMNIMGDDTLTDLSVELDEQKLKRAHALKLNIFDLLLKMSKQPMYPNMNDIYVQVQALYANVLSDINTLTFPDSYDKDEHEYARLSLEYLQIIMPPSRPFSKTFEGFTGNTPEESWVGWKEYLAASGIVLLSAVALTIYLRKK